MCKDKGAYGNSLNFFIQFFCEHESSLKNKVGYFFFLIETSQNHTWEVHVQEVLSGA